MLPVADPLRQLVRYPVRLAGNYACRALASGLSWKLLAVFRRGFYCQNSAGSLIFVGSLSIRPGPLNVLCTAPDSIDWAAEVLTPDAPVEFDGETLRIDDRIGLRLRHVGRWQPEDISKDWTREVVADRLKILSAEARRREPADGLGSLILSFCERRRRPARPSTPLLKMAAAGAAGISAWLKSEFSGKPGAIADDEIRRLIGLGPGLTPAGDDFLGGILIALYGLGRQDLSCRLADCVLPMARVRTGKISFAHLVCASQGQGNEALHRALAALSVKREAGLSSALRSIDAVGHTSGWDAVAGIALVLAALLATEQEKKPTIGS